MATDLGRNWWLLALRGVAGILFGIVAFVWPESILAALVLVFGAYVFVDGIFALIAGIGMRRQLSLWWLVLLEGAAGIILGVLTFRSPDTTALVLVTLIAAWSIVTSVIEIVTAVRIRAMIANEWTLILSGVVSIIFGILLIAQPGAGAVSIVWLLGAYALLFGILTLMLAFRLRGMREGMGRQATGAPILCIERMCTTAGAHSWESHKHRLLLWKAMPEHEVATELRAGIGSRTPRRRAALARAHGPPSSYGSSGESKNTITKR